MSAVSDNNQVNFNPTWMQSPASRGDKPGFNRSPLDSDDSSKEMMAPVFAKHRYGREDILALELTGTKPPDGLLQCPFLVEEGQAPIILTSLSETELRLQQNINSSKALSLITHQERMSINGTGNGSSPNSPWITPGTRGGRQPVSRWSALTTGEASGGSTYVKAGMGRGSAALGRGGGGSAGRGGFRGGFDKSNPSNTGDRTRTRFKSSGEEEWTVVGSKSNTSNDSSGNVWRGTGTNGRQDPAEESNGFNRSRGTGTAAGPVRGGIGRFSGNTDRFYPDFKRSESHEPQEDWAAEEKVPERQVSSNSPPRTTIGQFSASQQPSNEAVTDSNTSKSAPEAPVPEQDVLHGLMNSITSSPVTEYESWYYLDPDGQQHGPYEAPQMLIWYKNRFFKEDLRCRRSDERNFTTLGELIKMNGMNDPFAPRRRSEPHQMVENTWIDQERDPKFLESQRVIIEERRRLEEQQERLRREEQERLEREYRIRMMEQELERRQVELQRAAIAKEEEIEERRRQLAEFERQREEAERRAAEQRAKEAAELIRLQEEREREKRELEAQQRAAEEVIRRERERVEKEALMLRNQVIMEARRLAAEEAERQRNLTLQEQRAREEQLQEQRQQQLYEAQKKREVEEAVVREAAARVTAAVAASKIAPWVAKTVEKPPLHTQRSLLEIQLEEERKLAEQRKKEQEIFEQQRRQQKIMPIGPWSGTVAPSVAKTAPKNDVAWPAIPPSTLPKKEVPKPNQPSTTKANDNKKKEKEKNNDDEFKKWAVKAINQLNKTVCANVEAEPFTAFIMGVENPDEVEDYFLSYFGESGPVKDFHKEFLEKRIELRPRPKLNDKDDLSTAQAAVTSAPVQPTPPAAQPAGKKKKKNKAAKTIDINVLGFKPAGDPNRINAGEIDTAPPVSPPRRKR